MARATPSSLNAQRFFRRTAAPRDDHHIQVLDPLNQLERRYDAGRRILALDPAVGDQDLHGAALRSHANDVPQGSARSARDDADPTRKRGQRALSLRVEQAFGFELRTQPSELSCEVALARELRRASDQLKLAARRIERKRPAKADAGPIFERCLGPADVGLKHDTSQLCGVFLVVEREIDVTLRAPYVGQLALDEHLPQLSSSVRRTARLTSLTRKTRSSPSWPWL